ncbi:MAG: fibronectin type III domain-containing protein [Myxococcales bacterium]|nr:fibronectin type III domain-containing protein [Myxococcales bacterium]
MKTNWVRALASGLILSSMMAGCGDDATTPPATDAGAVDSGAVDSGAVDSGAVDSGAVDAGRADSGPTDAGATDAGATDAGPTDAGAADAGRGDAAVAALQTSGGVSRVATTAAPAEGTAIFLRLRTAAGAPPTGATAVSVTGPTGWNGGMPFTFNYPANGNFFGTYPAIAPVNGMYTVSMTVDGAPVTSSFALNTAATPLLDPTGTVTVTNASATGLTGTWAAVPNAVSYRLAVRDTSTTPPTLVGSTRVTATTATLSGLTLDTTRTNYDVEVLAYTTNLAMPDVAEPPSPFNVSFRRVPLTFGGGGGMAVLQSSGGVSQTASTLTPTLGTAVFLRLRTAAGAAPTAPVTVTVTGPGAGTPLGWNGGMPFTTTYPANGAFFGAYPAIAPANGNYTLAATLDGAMVNSNFTIDTAAPPQLAPTASVTLSAITTAGLTATWPAVVGAVSYRLGIRDTSTTPPTLVASTRVATTTASLAGLTLDRTRTTYEAEVLAYTTNLAVTDVSAPPSPFNVSFRRVPVAIP